MDYNKVYNALIDRAKNRILVNEYVEIHHVVPSCLGGLDDPDNLVKLLAREHYLAHLLLVKMHQNHRGLIYAATMMSSGECKDKTQQLHRSGNRNYEWLRKRFADVHKDLMYVTNGEVDKMIRKNDVIPEGFWKGYSENHKNPSSAGLLWVTNGLIDTRVKPDCIPAGFYLGRTFKPSLGKICITNGVETKQINATDTIPTGWMKGHCNNFGPKGTVWITNGIEDAHLNENNEIPIGWKLGRCAKLCFGLICITNGREERKIEQGSIIPDGWWLGSKTKGMICITDGKEDRRIGQTEIIPIGFRRGMSKNNTLGRMYITNGTLNKMINPLSEIPMGWQKGMTKRKVIRA